MKRFLVALAATLAAGCSTVAERPTLPQDPSVAWRARQSRLSTVDVWEIQGRISARTATEGWQASLRWVRDGERHSIDLWGPLGRGHVQLTQDDSGARLRDAKNRIYSADTSQQLLLDTTGWRLPLEGLIYWVLGLPVPGAPATQALDESGRLKSLDQLGWQVRFLRYQRRGGYEFPGKLFMRRRLTSADPQTADGSESNGPLLEVRLVIERWSTVP